MTAIIWKFFFKWYENEKNYSRLIFKPADKGQGLVCLNRLDYMKEGYRQLADTALYLKQDTDSADKFQREISFCLEDMFQNSEIDDTTKKFLF